MANEDLQGLIFKRLIAEIDENMARLEAVLSHDTRAAPQIVELQRVDSDEFGSRPGGVKCLSVVRS